MELGKKKLNVLMLIPDLPANLQQIKGGVHSAVISLLEGFSSISDINIEVLTFTKIKQSDITVCFSKNCSINYIWEGPFNYHLLNYILRSSRIIKNYIQTLKPDIIHYQVGNGFLLSKIMLSTKTPFVQTIHGFSNYEAAIKKKFADKLKWKINHYLNEKLMCRNIIHLSSFSKNIHTSASIKNNSIIPNAIKASYFNIKSKRNFNSNLLFIGQLDNNKNCLFAIDLLHKLSQEDDEYTLHIAGGVTDTNYHKKLLGAIKEHNLHNKITFHGWVNEKEKYKLLENADILLVPSYHESFPMVILEGMASSKITLANKTGGIPEMVLDKKNGFLLDIKKSEDWSKSVKLVKAYRNIRQDIQHNAREYALHHFSTQSVANATYSFYQHLTHHASHKK